MMSCNIFLPFECKSIKYYFGFWSSFMNVHAKITTNYLTLIKTVFFLPFRYLFQRYQKRYMIMLLNDSYWCLLGRSYPWWKNIFVFVLFKTLLLKSIFEDNEVISWLLRDKIWSYWKMTLGINWYFGIKF